MSDTSVCVFVLSLGVRCPSEELHTCHWGVPHHSLQDVHHVKVKTKLCQLLFINTHLFNAAICQLKPFSGRERADKQKTQVCVASLVMTFPW